MSMQNELDPIIEEESLVETEPRVNEGAPGWLSQSSADIVNILSVFIVGTIAFGILSLVTGYVGPVSEHLLSWCVFLIIVALLVVGIWRFSVIAMKKEQIDQTVSTYVISDWSIKTLRAASLPSDLTDGLEDILQRGKKLDPPKTEFVIDNINDRTAGTWIGDLELLLGKPRVKEFEVILFKYTKRIKYE